MSMFEQSLVVKFFETGPVLVSVCKLFEICSWITQTVVWWCRVDNSKQLLSVCVILSCDSQQVLRVGDCNA